jgi:hypothetical protein
MSCEDGNLRGLLLLWKTKAHEVYPAENDGTLVSNTQDQNK